MSNKSLLEKFLNYFIQVIELPTAPFFGFGEGIMNGFDGGPYAYNPSDVRGLIQSMRRGRMSPPLGVAYFTLAFPTYFRPSDG